MENLELEGRIQTAFGHIIASNTVAAALCRAHTNKDLLETALKDFATISQDLLTMLEQNYPGRGNLVRQVYEQQMSAFRQAIRPG